ncbi:MAG: DUF3311 domain-containing protein [Desulfurococcaceae archaeon]
MSKKLFYAIILVLAYIPLLGLPFSNRVEPEILGMPLLWFYCLAWFLEIFALMVVAYYVDKKHVWG